MTAPFELLETLRWQPGGGYFLAAGHAGRMQASARHWGFPFDPRAFHAALATCAQDLPAQAHRVRLVLDATGRFAAQALPLTVDKRPLRVCFAPWPVDADDPLLAYKTTRRELYQELQAACPAYAEVLLWNRRGEVTEACTANLAVYLDGHWQTPARYCGLLPGTLREALLQRGCLREAVLTRTDVERTRALYLISSVRLWRMAWLETR